MRNKYNAKPTWVSRQYPFPRSATPVEGWQRVASLGEAERYQQLLRLEHQGRISSLVTQYGFPLEVVGENGEVTRIGKYVADFVYFSDDGNRIVEDFKGMRTALYRWKKAHWEAQYGDSILETNRSWTTTRSRKPSATSGVPGAASTRTRRSWPRRKSSSPSAS